MSKKIYSRKKVIEMLKVEYAIGKSYADDPNVSIRSYWIGTADTAYWAIRLLEEGEK